MPNIVRHFQPGGFYHVYNRGNHKEPVFLEVFDFRYFLRLVEENADKYKIEILAYCLMRNHYHFLVRQLGDDNDSIRRWIGGSAMSYVNYFNRKYNQVGCLFQGRYRAKPVLTDEYLIYLSRYIHLNPDEFTDPLTYPWSSLQNYINGKGGVANPAYILKLLDGQSYELGSRTFLAVKSTTSVTTSAS